MSSELAQATKKDEKSPKRGLARGILQKSKSMTVQNFVEEIRWMKVVSLFALKFVEKRTSGLGENSVLSTPIHSKRVNIYFHLASVLVLAPLDGWGVFI